MVRDDLVRLARHNIEHVKAGTADQETDILTVPSEIYTDPELWERERQRIFLRLPTVVAMTAELREPGDYRSVELMGRPVLVVRQKDGSVQTFANMCSHRGSELVPPGNGRAARFTCPFHGWTYARSGELLAYPSSGSFGNLDKTCFGLTKLRTHEAAGFVWAILDPESKIDFEAFLSGYDKTIDLFNLKDWHVYDRKILRSANWKLMYDGYVDFYHLPSLHRKTFKTKFSNEALNYRWGPHQRVTTPDKSLLKLESQPEEDWGVLQMMKGVWPMFPTGALISIDGQGTRMMFSQIFPGENVLEGYSTHVFLTASKLETQEELDLAAEQFTFLTDVLRDEDYTCAEGVQKNLVAGTRDSLVFGRNEPGSQAFHRWVEEITKTEDDEEVNALFRRAHNKRFVSDGPVCA